MTDERLKAVASHVQREISDMFGIPLVNVGVLVYVDALGDIQLDCKIHKFNVETYESNQVGADGLWSA